MPEVVISALLLMTVFFWGMSFVFIRQALVQLSPLELTALRFFIASGGFLAYLAFAKKSWVRIERRDYLRFLALGLLGVGIYHLALNFGEQWIKAGTASLIVATNPLLIALLAALILKERLSVNKIFGLVIAFTGLVIVLSRGAGVAAAASGKPWLGTVLVFGAALAWSFYSILAKPLFARYPSTTVTAYTTLVGTVMLVPLTPSTLWASAAHLTPGTWIAILFISLLSTCIGYLCWYFALSKRDASQVAAFMYLNPVFSTLGALVLLREPLTLQLLGGGTLVVLGVALANLKTRPKNQENLASGAGNPIDG